MRFKSLAIAAGLVLPSLAVAAPVSIEFQASINFSNIKVETWTMGLTYDPDTLPPQTGSAFYSEGLTGYLKKGDQVAGVDRIEVQMSEPTITGIHSFVLRYIIDEYPYSDSSCSTPLWCDDDQNDGLSFVMPDDTPWNFDVNRFQISFGGDTDIHGLLFPQPPALGEDLSFIGRDDLWVSANMDVFGMGNNYGSNFRVVSTNTVTVSNYRVLDEGVGGEPGGGLPSVPLPAPAFLLLAGLGGLGLLRRRT